MNTKPAFVALAIISILVAGFAFLIGEGGAGIFMTGFAVVFSFVAMIEPGKRFYD